MRTFELRVYKLRTKEALDFYMEKIYPCHRLLDRQGGCRATALRAGLLCSGRRTRRGRSAVYAKHRIR